MLAATAAHATGYTAFPMLNLNSLTIADGNGVAEEGGGGVEIVFATVVNVTNAYS